MLQYSYQDNVTQPALITSHSLDSKELDLVDSIANWRSPEQWNDYLIDIHGRSLVFKSPTRNSTLEDTTNGIYDSLQIIGAGGSSAILDQAIEAGKSYGFFKPPKEYLIQPVDDANHSIELDLISQVREFDENGQLVLSDKEYVPLRGMTASEASSRASFTNFIERNLSEGRRMYGAPSILTPHLAAEGILEGKVDDAGQNLSFHVYRVPSSPRIPK